MREHIVANTLRARFFTMLLVLPQCGGAVEVGTVLDASKAASEEQAEAAPALSNTVPPSSPACGQAVCGSGPDVSWPANDSQGPCDVTSLVGHCTGADIVASNYNQMCRTDSDCTVVGEGQSCKPCSLAYGPFGAISVSAVAQYIADYRNTPGGREPPGSCPSAPGCVRTTNYNACCRGGGCRVGIACLDDGGASD
jgi:hypothetical protein